MTSFSDFRLAEPILQRLAEEGYAQPTAIQAAAIPIVVDGRDVVGIAQTGTGKTAAFAVPILNRLALDRQRRKPKSCRVLVLSPTRELANQITQTFRTLGKKLGIRAELVIGGVSMGGQIRTLREGTDILVATPGRLLDLCSERAFELGSVDTLVVDEADQMLDMGFIRDIRKIVGMMPKERQTLLFSATMPEAIASLADALLRNPEKIAVTPVASTVEVIDQRVIHVDRERKSALLAEVLREATVDRALVFTRTKRGADKVAKGLEAAGIPAEAIHGNKSQNQRDRVMQAFRKGDIRTLVATDIAARGIDVRGVSHVINFDLPEVPESYVHRIGRTARAGAEGTAISLCHSEDAGHLRAIEKLIRQAIPATDRRTGRAEAAARRAEPASQQLEPASRQVDGESARPAGKSRRPDRKPRRPFRAPRPSDGAARQIEATSERSDAMPQRQDAAPRRAEGARHRPDGASARPDGASRRPDAKPRRADGKSRRPDGAPRPSDAKSRRPKWRRRRFPGSGAPAAALQGG